MARANTLLNEHHAAVGLFQQLSYQMTSSNNHDESFLRLLNDYLDKNNSPTTNCNLPCTLILLLLCFLSNLSQ